MRCIHCVGMLNISIFRSSYLTAPSLFWRLKKGEGWLGYDVGNRCIVNIGAKGTIRFGPTRSNGEHSNGEELATEGGDDEWCSKRLAAMLVLTHAPRVWLRKPPIVFLRDTIYYSL
jgi:hypothetical protein